MSARKKAASPPEQDRVADDTLVRPAETPTPAPEKPAPQLVATEVGGGTALGHAVWLMTQIPAYRYTFLADLEWMVMPPILLKQDQLFNVDGKVAAFAAWASVSEEVEARLQQPNPRLARIDWECGDRVRLAILFARFGHTEIVLKKRLTRSLIGRPCKMHRGIRKVTVGKLWYGTLAKPDNKWL
jgi:hemolysin-activating ACP:hemolysin acyltransferase